MTNPPFSLKHPNYCQVCGHVMMHKRVISHYDSESGFPVYKDVFECADAGSAHGTTEVPVFYENDDDEQQESSLFSFLRKLFGGGS